jgi:hypothetical protein
MTGKAKKSPTLRKRTPAPKAKKALMGRPLKYRTLMCQQVIDFAKDHERGATVAQIAVELDVSRSTIWAWMDDHPDFSVAVKRAKDIALSKYETDLALMGVGKIDGANATAHIWRAKNQFPDDYRDRKEFVVESKGVVEIDFMGSDGALIGFDDIVSEQ